MLSDALKYCVFHTEEQLIFGEAQWMSSKQSENEEAFENINQQK